MEAGDTNFAEYSNIMAAVDKAIQESYYRMCSEKMISKVKLNENTASRDQPAQNNIKCHTPGAPKKSKKHATFPSTDDEHNKLDESEHIPGNTNDASSVDNINTVTTATEDIIDKNVFDQNTMHTSKNVEKCLENIDIVKGNHNNCQDNPTFKNIEDESKEDKELDSQISVFDNDDSAEKNKTKFGSENIGVCENQTGPFCIIKRENNTTENEPLINSEHDIGVDRGNEKGMNCRDCGNKFPNAYQLSQHKRTVPECGSSNIVRSYRCQLCERLFSSSSRLRKHLRTHLGTKPYKCNICQKQFTQSHNLKRHILIHTGEQPFQCLICKLSFTCAANTKRHIKVKHATDVEAAADPEGFAESLIKRTTPMSISLKDESLATILEIPAEESEEIIMPKRRKFGSGKVCLICDRKFTRSSHLRDHMHSHTGERPYQCHICEYNTNFKSGLNKHLRIHTGIKPYSCAFCERTYYSPSDRDTHQVQIHSKEKDFVCGVCGAQFARPFMLKRHVEHCHVLGYEVTCDRCQKQFKTEAVLRRHKQKYCHQPIEDRGSSEAS